MLISALAVFQDSSSQSVTPQQTQQMVSAFMGVYFIFILLAFAVKIALYAIPMWRICKRAGLAPQLSLLCAIPLVGRLVTTYVMAFADWKVVPINQAMPLAAAGLPAAAELPADPTRSVASTQPIASLQLASKYGASLRHKP